jgi:hypothetical protein
MTRSLSSSSVKIHGIREPRSREKEHIWAVYGMSGDIMYLTDTFLDIHMGTRLRAGFAGHVAQAVEILSLNGGTVLNEY